MKGRLRAEGHGGGEDPFILHPAREKDVDRAKLRRHAYQKRAFNCDVPDRL